MSPISSSEYYNECQSIVQDLLEDVVEREGWRDKDKCDTVNAVIEQLFEVLYCHEWIIYTCYHLQILQISSNNEELIDSQGEEAAVCILKERGLHGLYCALAHAAMYQDCSEYCNEVVQEW